MINAIWLLAGAVRRLFCDRRRLLLENLALRQQLAALKRRHPRPRLAAFDKLFWVFVRRFWSGWQQALIIVSPETVEEALPELDQFGNGKLVLFTILKVPGNSYFLAYQVGLGSVLAPRGRCKYGHEDQQKRTAQAGANPNKRFHQRFGNCPEIA